MVGAQVARHAQVQKRVDRIRLAVQGGRRR